MEAHGFQWDHCIDGGIVIESALVVQPEAGAPAE
jgi:hypothetical protein